MSCGKEERCPRKRVTSSDNTMLCMKKIPEQLVKGRWERERRKIMETGKKTKEERGKKRSREEEKEEN